MVVLAAGGQAARGPVGRPGSAAVGAVVLLDEHSRPAALLKPLLFIVASELALDQDGRLGHLLIECKLQTWGGGTGAELEGQRPEPLRVTPRFNWCKSLIHTLTERLNHHGQPHTQTSCLIP